MLDGEGLVVIGVIFDFQHRVSEDDIKVPLIADDATNNPFAENFVNTPRIALRMCLEAPSFVCFVPFVVSPPLRFPR